MTTFERLGAVVDTWAGRLTGLAADLHAHPEQNFAEHHAHEALTGLLDQAGFDVTRHAHGIDTAFVARRGSGSGPLVAVLCEYDALPELGHGCGHNLIAAMGAGAGIAAATMVDELDGRLLVIGTPAEEGGGGKIDLLNAGAFDEVDIALMAHPADADLTRMDAIAVSQYRARYTGLAAHAAAAPEAGRNALDAAVLGYVNVAALRQHIGSDERIHGIFTRAGDAANVVPAQTESVWFVRSPTLASLEPLVERVQDCLEAGASAAGCSVSVEKIHHTFADMIDNPVLVAEYARIAGQLGREVRVPDGVRRVVGSTDMGNVSHRVPAIHPMIAVAPEGVAIHTADFARAAVGSDADRAVLDGSKILAHLAVRCWSDLAVVSSARAAYEEAIHSQGRTHL